MALTDGTSGRLLDCSEDELRYRAREGHALPAAALIVGEAQVRAGGAQPFRRTVIRVDERAVALRLVAPGLPLRALFAEQRAMLARYPGAG